MLDNSLHERSYQSAIISVSEGKTNSGITNLVAEKLGQVLLHHRTGGVGVEGPAGSRDGANHAVNVDCCIGNAPQEKLLVDDFLAILDQQLFAREAERLDRLKK